MGRTKTANKKREFTAGVFSSSSSANNSQNATTHHNQEETIEFTEDNGSHANKNGDTMTSVDPMTATMGSYDQNSQQRIESALFREIHQTRQRNILSQDYDFFAEKTLCS